MVATVIRELKEGDKCRFPKMGDKVTVHYTGCIASTGRPFDSSRCHALASSPERVPICVACNRARGHAFTFVLGVGKVPHPMYICGYLSSGTQTRRLPQVIKGWETHVPKMSVGQRTELHFTSDDGYGPKGHPPTIPPSTDLQFDIEVLCINETLVQAPTPPAAPPPRAPHGHFAAHFRARASGANTLRQGDGRHGARRGGGAGESAGEGGAR